MHIGYLVDPIYDLRYVNAILCSKLMNFYHHAISLEFDRAMAQIDIETLDQLPLPKVFAKRNTSNNENLEFSIYINDLLQDSNQNKLHQLLIVFWPQLAMKTIMTFYRLLSKSY